MFEYKQVMIVREDLEMSRGKLAVQVAHASLSAVEKTRELKPDWFDEWRKKQQKKVVLKVSSIEELESLKNKADSMNIPNALISDAGLTELESGTKTVLGVGPGPKDEIDKISGELSLLR